MNIADFIERWAPSTGERAVLDLPEPDPKVNDPVKDRYVFERDVLIQAPDGKATTHFIDLYRERAVSFSKPNRPPNQRHRSARVKRRRHSWQLDDCAPL